ncbi:MAG TPA: HU family DNA-binding protein [Pyrinomonadaceae bacterium]|nr:HU family DNA-binding protein [Pyrinomonadaceae bacterium]
MRNFDHRSHRLFALSERNVEYYPIRSECRYFQQLLERPSLKHESPFFRLSLAKGTQRPELIVREIIPCLKDLRRGPDGFLDLWYESQREQLPREIRQRSLPPDWRLLLDSPSAGSTRQRAFKVDPERFRVPADFLGLGSRTYQAAYIRHLNAAPARAHKGGMTEAEVVNHLADKVGVGAPLVKNFLRELARLAAREVRANKEFPLPRFGKLVLLQGPRRAGRNPATGGSFKIPPRRTLEFHVSKRMEESVTRRGPFKSSSTSGRARRG